MAKEESNGIEFDIDTDINNLQDTAKRERKNRFG